MLSRIRRLPSPALIVASIALVLAAAGGIGYAASKINGQNIKKNSIPGNRLKKNTVTGKQIKESSLGKVPKSAHADNADHATNADTAANANNLGGQPASSYAPATTLRTALVHANGTVDAAHSDGVSQANVTQPVGGVYCFNGLSPAPRSVVASVAGGQATVQTQVQYAPTGGVCAGSQFDVATVTDANALFPEAFTVFIH
jgi:hypothetical protein